MPVRSAAPRLSGAWVGAAAAALLPLALAVPLLELWNADFGVPLHDGTDVPYIRMLVQEI